MTPGGICRPAPQSLAAWFITGTDTDVGKTVVAAGLVRALRRRGRDVGVFKPVSSGCRRVGGRRLNDDVEHLREAAWGAVDGLPVRSPAGSIEDVNPVALRDPLSPDQAARRMGRRIQYAPLAAAFRRVRLRHECLVVEGAGGLLVPLAPDLVVADLAIRWRLPVVLVTRPGLGTLNHTRLTVEAMRRRGLRLAALVINHIRPGRPGLAERENLRALPRWAGAPPTFVVPYLSDPWRDGPARRVFARLAQTLAGGPR